MTKIFVLMIPLLITFFGGVMLFSEYRAMTTAESSQQWETVAGEIVAAEFECTTTVHSRNVTEDSCFPVTRYRYEVGDEVYLGERINAADSQQSFETHQEASESASQLYPVGMSVDVYYNPQNPGSALLEPGSDNTGSSLEGVITGVVFLLLGLGIAGALGWFWWFKRKDAET